MYNPESWFKLFYFFKQRGNYNRGYIIKTSSNNRILTLFLTKTPILKKEKKKSEKKTSVLALKFYQK